MKKLRHVFILTVESWVSHTLTNTLAINHTSPETSKGSKGLDTGNVIIFILCVCVGSRVPIHMCAQVSVCAF